jgi:serine/threonine-protein kinase
MDTPSADPTLLRPDRRRRSFDSVWGSHGLPRDLLRQSTHRVRVLALLYASVFFFAAFFPNLLFDRAMLFSTIVHWLPGTISIVVALVVAAVSSPSRPPRALAATALVFEVASSYGIAAAELLQPRGLDFRHATWIGLSWVSVWMLLFTVVVPSSPRRAVLAALAAASSVPVMAAVSFATYPPPLAPDRGQFFFLFVFPYLLVVVMAYVGARVLSALGDEVRKARELGSYRLIERIGHGGMGEVWLARHRMLARPAAVKLIRAAGGGSARDTEAASRFEREAQAIACLRSPHTVNLFDFGVADDGTFYYVMELLDGLDAERLVKQFGPMPPERVIHVIRQVCHSLSEAESIALVHRDIKPANIFLCRYGEDDDFVKVLDFGIVKAIHDPNAVETASTQTALTAVHAVRGTPAFIAPEQALGGHSVDHRADIYGIGCVAYWLLTGRLVFSADTPMGLLVQHAQATPEPPSTRTDQPIPAELDAIVLACLAKDPSGRPETARELARRLETVPVSAPWTEERARQWWDTHMPRPGRRAG